ncbi:MAG TPA: DNA methyltransferase [Candidatus Hypogeohydataceae bacterium YC41]
MGKNLKPKEQLTMFATCESLTLNENMMRDFDKQFMRNVINLRQELKDDIPSTTYLTHGIHNVYPAKFIPQVPRFVIKRFNLKGKIILDPFAGSGTTAVESLITGNSNISNDINPITKFLMEVQNYGKVFR